MFNLAEKKCKIKNVVPGQRWSIMIIVPPQIFFSTSLIFFFFFGIIQSDSNVRIYKFLFRNGFLVFLISFFRNKSVECFVVLNKKNIFKVISVHKRRENVSCKTCFQHKTTHWIFVYPYNRTFFVPKVVLKIFYTNE